MEVCPALFLGTFLFDGFGKPKGNQSFWGVLNDILYHFATYSHLGGGLVFQTTRSTSSIGLQLAPTYSTLPYGHVCVCVAS